MWRQSAAPQVDHPKRKDQSQSWPGPGHDIFILQRASKGRKHQPQITRTMHYHSNTSSVHTVLLYAALTCWTLVMCTLHCCCTLEERGTAVYIYQVQYELTKALHLHRTTCTMMHTHTCSKGQHRANTKVHFLSLSLYVLLKCTSVRSSSVQHPPIRLKTCSGTSSRLLEVRFNDPDALACLRSFFKEAADDSGAEVLTSNAGERCRPRPLLAARMAWTTLCLSLPPPRADPALLASLPDDAICAAGG